MDYQLPYLYLISLQVLRVEHQHLLAMKQRVAMMRVGEQRMSGMKVKERRKQKWRMILCANPRPLPLSMKSFSSTVVCDPVFHGLML